MSLFEPKMMKNQGLPSSLRASEQGSVIVWILIMVSLFAALGYAVSQGSRGSTAQMDEQQASLAATEILDYARQIKDAVRQLQINGCDETEVSFDQAVVSGYSNPNAPSDNSCDVFHANGGGLRYREPDQEWLLNQYSSEFFFGEIVFSGETCVNDVPQEEEGDVNCNILTTDVNEITLILPYINLALCKAINKAVGFNAPTYEPGLDNGSSFRTTSKFDGDHGTSTMMIKEGGHQGVLTSCYQSSGPSPIANSYNFYQVLLAR